MDRPQLSTHLGGVLSFGFYGLASLLGNLGHLQPDYPLFNFGNNLALLLEAAMITVAAAWAILNPAIRVVKMLLIDSADPNF